MDEDIEFPVVWFTAAFLFAIWESRSNASRVRKYKITAEIEEKVSLLRETRCHEHVENLELFCQEIVKIRTEINDKNQNEDPAEDSDTTTTKLAMEVSDDN